MKSRLLPNGLSKRANRLLAKAGFSIEKKVIVKALQTGKLYPNCRPPTYGRYTHREVCRWAGVDSATLTWPDRDAKPYLNNGLSFRANNCLKYAGVPITKESVIQALKNGVLLPTKRPCGYGKVTHAEICRWAGVDPKVLHKSHLRVAK